MGLPSSVFKFLTLSLVGTLAEEITAVSGKLGCNFGAVIRFCVSQPLPRFSALRSTAAGGILGSDEGITFISRLYALAGLLADLGEV